MMHTLLRHGALVAGGLAGVWLATRAFLRSRRAWSFRDRVVLITGGSRGLGLSIARRLTDEGARVAICARDADELDRAAAELRSRGSPVVALVCDLAQAEACEQMIREVTEQLGPVDVLINNAGVIQVGPYETMTLEDFRQAMAVHFWAPLLTTSFVLPAMRQRGAGRIVNIASIGGRIAVPHMLPYSASKFALVGLSRGLRSEFSAMPGSGTSTLVRGVFQDPCGNADRIRHRRRGPGLSSAARRTAVVAGRGNDRSELQGSIVSINP